MQDVAHERFEYAFLNKNKTTMAKDTATGRNVCIKRWERGDFGAVNEIAVLTSLSCKGVPDFICSFEDDTNKYMAEEWIEGCTLEEYLADKRVICTSDAVELVIQICSIIEDLHQSDEGYLHLDIKPSNIMITGDRDIYIIDFESARIIRHDETDCEASTVRLVSETYSSPEVFFGKATVQSDVFSIGMVAKDIFANVDNVSDHLLKIVEKCTSFNAADRYRNVTELKKALLYCEEKADDSLAIVVDYNMCFSGEMASIMWGEYKLTVGVFALSERGENRLIYYSMPGEYFTHKSTNRDMLVGEDGDTIRFPIMYPGNNKNVLFYKGKKDWIRSKCLHKINDREELYISGMNFVEEILLNDYEEAQDFISWGKQHFDIVIIATDRNDDKVTADIMCNLCDYVIATPQSNIDDVETVYQFFRAHSVKNGYDVSKVLFVAWDYDETNSLPEESIKIMVGQSQYLGAIDRTDLRQYKRNYVIDGRLSTRENNINQYKKIIDKLLNRRTERN